MLIKRVYCSRLKGTPFHPVEKTFLIGSTGKTDNGSSPLKLCFKYRLVRTAGFDRVNTAAYSPRPGTPAADWSNQVSLDKRKIGKNTSGKHLQ